MRKIVFIAMALLLAAEIGFVWFPFRVTEAAHKVANGHPFCLHIPKPNPHGRGFTLQAASSWQDITPFVMRGKDSEYHATLVVDEGDRLAMYNWSYRSMSFRTDIKGDTARFALFCKPGKSLLEGPLGDADRLVFIDEGVRWTISNAYRPMVSHSGGGVSISALEPDFRPLPAGDDNRGHRASIQIDDEEVERRRRWMEQRLGFETYRRPGHQIISKRDGEGALVEVTTCMPLESNNPRPCSSEFIRDGMIYSFDHQPMPKDQWLRLQDTLVEKMRSFRSVQ